MTTRHDNPHGAAFGCPAPTWAGWRTAPWQVWVTILLVLGVTRLAARGQEFVDPRLEYNVKAVSLYAF